MHKLLRQALYLGLMLVSAGIVFSLVGYVADGFKIKFIDFEQQCAAGLLAAVIVPLIAYNRSAAPEDRRLTVIQFCILCVTALFGFSAKMFLHKGVWLFLAWFACAGIATVTLCYMVERLWKKNGYTPMASDLESWTKHLGFLQTIETVLEERVVQIRYLEGNGAVQLHHLDHALLSIQTERKRLEEQLKDFGISPAPVLGDETMNGEGQIHGRDLH